MMIREILVALDSSPRAPGVFGAAVEIGAPFHARVHPFRAVSIPPEFPAAAFGSVSDPLPARVKKLALGELARLVEGTTAVDVAPPIVRIGDPARLILEVCDELGVDLVVLGTHGYRGLDRLLGTTAAYVANLAKCSVLVVHERAAHGPVHGRADVPGAAP